MKKAIGLMTLLAVFALAPGQAQAQRRGGGGTVNTPFGQFNSRDMAAAGGNPFAAEDMRDQKLMMQYQQQMMKQQQQYMQQMAKQQKAKADYLKAHPEAAKGMVAANKNPTRASKKAANKSASNSAGATTKAAPKEKLAAVPGAPAPK